MPKLNVIFLGTPDFAVASLDAIHKSKHNVLAVITTPDKPAGRGRKMHASAVKKYAIENDLKVLQPEKLKNKTFLEEVENLNADIMVVVAFRIMPKALYAIPKYGTFNLHGSLLPELRGAAPINFAIINGLKETGVTTFFLDEKVDTGSILLQDKTTISPQETAGTLHDRLMLIGKKLVVKTLDLIAKDEIAPKPQNADKTCYAPKIDSDFCEINWKESLELIDRKIRGLSPYPGAYTWIVIDNKKLRLKVFLGEILIEESSNKTNEFSFDNKKLCFHHKDGIYQIKELQLEGKRKMKAQEFLNGLK